MASGTQAKVSRAVTARFFCNPLKGLEYTFTADATIPEPKANSSGNEAKPSAVTWLNRNAKPIDAAKATANFLIGVLAVLKKSAKVTKATMIGTNAPKTSIPNVSVIIIGA